MVRAALGRGQHVLAGGVETEDQRRQLVAVLDERLLDGAFRTATLDATNHPGKHPNIDRLIELIAQGTTLNVRLIEA